MGHVGEYNSHNCRDWDTAVLLLVIGCIIYERINPMEVKVGGVIYDDNVDQ